MYMYTVGEVHVHVHLHAGDVTCVLCLTEKKKRNYLTYKIFTCTVDSCCLQIELNFNLREYHHTYIYTCVILAASTVLLHDCMYIHDVIADADHTSE